MRNLFDAVNFGDLMDDMTTLKLEEAVKPVGESLVEFSKHAQTSARGLVTALFPYILPASER
jgi:hypothetical protein